MTKINEKQFISQFTGSGIDINQLSEETKQALEGAGVDLSKLDTNKDGVIKGKKELSNLFAIVDSFDTVTDRTIDTTYGQDLKTVGGLVNDALLNELSRNISQAQISGPHRAVAPKEKASVTNNENDLSSLPPTFDKDYFLKLADAPADQLKSWYHQQAGQDSKFIDNIRTNYSEVFNNAKMSTSEKARLDKLGDQLQKFQNERSSAWATEKYSKPTQNEIAKGFIDRIQIAEQKNGPEGRQAEINKIMQDIQFLAASGKGKADKVYSKAMGALQQAMKHEYSNSYAKGGKLNTIPRSELINAAARLEGSGSAAVKADLIKDMLQQRHAQKVVDVAAYFDGNMPKEMVKILAENSLDKVKANDLLSKLEKFEKVPGQAVLALQRFKDLTTKSTDEHYPGASIETLIKSDPGGLVHEFELMARDPKRPEVRQLLNQSLDAVYRAHRKDPQTAADLVGEMLADTAKDLAASAKKRPIDADLQREIQDHGHRVGYLLESAKHMVSTISQDEKKKIDEGAFIAGIFTKAVSKLTGFTGIGEVGDEVIGDMKKSEYSKVEQWQDGVEKGYFRIIDTVFYAGKPNARSGDSVDEFSKDLQTIYEEVRKGKATYDEVLQR